MAALFRDAKAVLDDSNLDDESMKQEDSTVLEAVESSTESNSDPDGLEIDAQLAEELQQISEDVETEYQGEDRCLLPCNRTLN